VEIIKASMPLICEKFPKVTVVTANIQPVHMAVLEGEEEIFLTPQKELKEYFNSVPLYIRPKSFFQTNPKVATKLYETARQWSRDLDAKKIWDLFCGVGGFGLHCATTDSRLTGIEIQTEAISCATRSAQELSLNDVHFRALDATLFQPDEVPQLLIVNPPRRGLGTELCERLSSMNIPNILYSSCNAKSLAEDLNSFKNYDLKQVQLFDMFPHTAHYEVLVQLQHK